MSDPYKVLGVSPSATDEEIKAAYRELAKKYHPDNYANTPLADFATEKMKEINEAYDTIAAGRRLSELWLWRWKFLLSEFRLQRCAQSDYDWQNRRRGTDSQRSAHGWQKCRVVLPERNRSV